MIEKDITICGHGSGHPSTKNLEAYNSSRYKQKAPNGVRKGLVEVRRPIGMTDDMRTAYRKNYAKILDRNIYSNKLRQYVYKAYTDGKYYSDCSSSQCATLQRVGIDVGLLNTAGMHNSQKFQNVPVVIENGHIRNPEILRVGDQLLYAGNDPARPLQIGHVEGVYSIKEDPAPDPKDIIKRGQKDSITFVGTKITVDGIRGPQTRKQAVRCIQKALNNDFRAGLVVDGILGPKTAAALAGKQVKKGQVMYLVTAAEILLELLGTDPNGVEYPGIYGNGLEKAAGSSVISAEMLRLWAEE